MKHLPPSMAAIEIKDGALRPCIRAIPKPKKGEVLVKVRAAGVNRPDLLQRMGRYPPPKGVTDIPGLEIAGTVERGAGKFKKGARVCALVAGGGYAEYCAVPAAQCLPIPAKMDFIAAAAMPETFFTVWVNLFTHGKLKKGESLLVHGGASGIGTAAIQIAKAMGAKVYVTAGTDKKCRACGKLGATLAVNYRKRDFVEDIKNATGGRGVDVILDMVGGDYVARNIELLAPGGRHVSIAMQGGRKAEVDIMAVMQKRLVLTGSTLRARGVAEKGAIARALLKHVWPLARRGRIAPVIDKTFPLAHAQKAHDWLEAGNHVGKVVLVVDHGVSG